MKQNNYIIKHNKNKHLNEIDYDIIISKITKFNSKITTKRNNGKTIFIRSLATEFNTSVSNIYYIINKAKITVLNYDLSEKHELSSTVAYSRRNKRQQANNSKLKKAKDFINIVISEVKSNKLSSIDETINYLKIHNKKAIKGLDTICSKTMYNYVKSGKITLKPIDLPRMLRRKNKNLNLILRRD